MKSIKVYLDWINPIYRDIILVLIAGILISSAIVTMGYVLVSRL